MKNNTSRFIAMGVTATAALLASSIASAETKVAPAAPFEACVGNAITSTVNAPAERIAEAPFSRYITDTNPDFDGVVFDFADGLDDSEVKAYGKTLGLTFRLNSKHSDEPNIYVADVEEGAVPYIIDCLAKNAPDGWIESVEENIEYQMLGKPNDPLYQFQWNFKQIDAEGAWGVSTGKDVVVAVIDTGVAMETDKNRKIIQAKDLAGTANVKGYDFVDKDNFAWDGHGHGTHVAGTIAQTTNNKYGVTGLAYEAKIMPLRVLNSRGFGQVSDIADSIRFAADNGAQVINMSLGGPLPSLVMKRAISYAHSKGVTIIAAAGNGGRKAPSYPAAYANVVSVAATQFDRHTTFYSQWGDYVDIAAPGGNTRIDQDGDGRPDGVMQETLKNGNTAEHDFALYMGTSMASPHVAAAAALVIAQGVTHPDKVEAVLKKSSTQDQKKRFKDSKEYAQRYGAGILHASDAAKTAVVEQGGIRFGSAIFLAFLALIGVRKRDQLGVAPKPNALFGAALIAASSGLFIIPLLFGDTYVGSMLASTIGRPMAELDATILGISWHQNPLMASALLPLLAIGFLGGHKRWKFFASGLAIGMAAFCLSEAFILTSDVQWIPGMDLLDRAWLAANGVFSFIIGYLSLKRN